MRARIRRWLLGVPLLALACGPAAIVPPPKGAPPPAPASACEDACANLKARGCPGGNDPDCAAACENIERLYRDGQSQLTLDPRCLARAGSCAEAERCGT